MLRTATSSISNSDAEEEVLSALTATFITDSPSHALKISN